jgi:hypothetical protein
MLRAIGAQDVPQRIESTSDRLRVQKYLDTKINSGWGRVLHSAQIYVVLVVGDERDRAVAQALLSTGKAEIEKFAVEFANALDAEVEKWDKTQELRAEAQKNWGPAWG